MRPSGPRREIGHTLYSYLGRRSYTAAQLCSGNCDIGGSLGRMGDCSDEFWSGYDLDADDLRDGRNLDHARQGITASATLDPSGSLPLIRAHEDRRQRLRAAWPVRAAWNPASS